MSTILIPGWAVPLGLYDPYNSDRIVDFGFSQADKHTLAVPAELPDFSYTPDESEKASGGNLVVAHSLGALVALRISQEFSDFGRFVVISGFARFTSAEGYDHGKPDSGVAMMLGALRLSSGMVLRKFYENMCHPAAFDIHPPGKPDVQRLAAGLEHLRKTDLRSSLKDIANPFLVIHGDSDRIVSPRLAEFLATNIPGAKLEIIPGAGHALPFTHAEKCLSLINEFQTSLP
ncbi:MAG: alpha/beta fold hydrolase [Victivallales bacterium]|nr:alpha/beta fold hydrolase [Victivallales bacterium]